MIRKRKMPRAPREKCPYCKTEYCPASEHRPRSVRGAFLFVKIRSESEESDILPGITAALLRDSLHAT